MVNHERFPNGLQELADYMHARALEFGICTSAGRFSCAAVLLAAVVRASLAAADTEVTINTDRPAVTESSVVVPEAALQIENGLLATDAQGRYTLDFPESDLRYGLADKTELRLTLPDYYHNLPAANAATSGFGDVAVGVKQQLGPAGGFDVSLVAFLSLPTGAHAISSHGYDPGVQLPWSHALSGNWTVAGQVAAYWPTVNGERNSTGEVTLLFDRQLSAPWDAFIEYAGDFPQRGGSSQLLHVGTAYKLAAHHQLDLHAAAGLSDATPRWFIGAGYSYLFLFRH
jgi:hypothetical protein